MVNRSRNRMSRKHLPLFLASQDQDSLKKGNLICISQGKLIKKRSRKMTINGAISQKLKIAVGSMEGVQFANYTTYLNIRVDKAMPYIWVGAAIS